MKYKIREIEEKDNKKIEKVIRDCLIEFGANHEGTAWADPNLLLWRTQTFSPKMQSTPTQKNKSFTSIRMKSGTSVTVTFFIFH